MGLLDSLLGGPDRTFRKHAERVANKRAQAIDRSASIEYLASERTADAVDALLARFTYSTEPTITDQEEKSRVFEAIVDAGEVALEPVRDFLAHVESLTWPMKILAELLQPADLVTELLGIVEELETEYERDPQRKIQAISFLEELSDPRIAPAISRFLEDANETVRFHAAGVLLAQKDEEEARTKLLERLSREESVRVRLRIAEGLADLGWGVQGYRAAVEKVLPEGFAIQSNGQIKKRG
ncbi:MAG: HEAT repeat domain-containing protein [Deltaproteobacteria bacterium]|nr:HEAT repeat domain-containing protein [Deltaproteobacteria bacterium]